MKKHKGFTLIELIIVSAIILIASGAFNNMYQHNKEVKGPNVTDLGNGKYIKSLCINGLLYTTDQNGITQQTIGVGGGAVACQNQN